ncbi:MAG: MarR family winged helix-turn-helix transcriptional regulator [Ilumatobacteraceae bacterium]
MTGRPLSERDYRTLAAFRKRLRQFLAFSEAAARDVGLTPNQHQLLLVIRGHPGHGKPSISDAADALRLQLHSTTELVGRAVDDGLVVRQHDPTDARRILLGLTDKGDRKLAALSDLHRGELQRFRAEISELGHLD